MNSLFRTFLRYTTLNILGMLGLSCYILADTYFIAQGLGAEGLTSLNLAIPIYSIIHGIGLMIGMGGATRYSILKGQKDTANLQSIFSHAIYFALVMAVTFSLIGSFASDSLTTLLGANVMIHKMTNIYIKTLLLFAPAFFVNNVLICFIRNDGNPKLSMIAMLTGSFSNIVLDYIFIFPLGKGMFGAALATGIAPVISILILSTHFLKHKGSNSSKEHMLQFICSKFKLGYIKDIINLGSTSFIMELSSGIVMIVFNMIILSKEGNIGIAAYGIIANLALVGIAIFTGLAQGVQPKLSQYYGRGDVTKVHKLYRYAMVTALMIAIGIYGVSIGFTKPIIVAFNKENSEYLTLLARTGMKLYFTAFIFIGINVINATYLSATDRPVSSLLISLLRGFILIVPIAFLLSTWFGMIGVWLTLTCSEIITLLISIIMMKRIKLSL